MPKRPVRRGQVIAPFGVGAMLVAQDGTSLIAAGLDNWYKREGSDGSPIDANEFQFSEWRLERELGVEWFGLPPDYRERRREFWAGEQTNIDLTIPFLRFPQWHVCPRCQGLGVFPLVLRETPRCAVCEANPERKSRKPLMMVQVRFIALCDRGHIQDFPWREWVHSTAQPTCDRPMKLIATGGASLAATKVVCECKKSRTLEQITEADASTERDASSYLTRNLSKDAEFKCQGKRPWLGDDLGGECLRPLRGSLRGATNVYFAMVRSSIYLPTGSSAPGELVELLKRPALGAIIRLSSQAGKPVDPKTLRGYAGDVLRSYTDGQLAAALSLISGVASEATPPLVEDEDRETAFRRTEFATLRTERAEDEIQTRLVPLIRYEARISRLLGNVTLVERLRETRVLTGFTRIYPENDQTLEERRLALWRDPPTGQRWLPAYRVYGEGIYLELAEELLREWESPEVVARRVAPLVKRYGEVQAQRKLRERIVTPRLVLLHTFAHLLMNQLTFECGYSTASLRERLYVSASEAAPMAGILIYTAAGDSEGTMGGLVRMGKPGNLEPVIRRAIQKARWCSADPVCMELGASGGQGPDSCNLAGCHNCVLSPETSCEEFNRFLDRALIIGTLEQPGLGFFTDL